MTSLFSKNNRDIKAMIYRSINLIWPLYSTLRNKQLRAHFFNSHCLGQLKHACEHSMGDSRDRQPRSRIFWALPCLGGFFGKPAIFVGVSWVRLFKEIFLFLRTIWVVFFSFLEMVMNVLNWNHWNPLQDVDSWSLEQSSWIILKSSLIFKFICIYIYIYISNIFIYSNDICHLYVSFLLVYQRSNPWSSFPTVN